MFSVTLELAMIMHLTNYGKTYPYTQHSASNPLLQRPSFLLAVAPFRLISIISAYNQG